MGTHPIFESDFDCLTDNEMSFNLSSLKSKVPNFTEKLESKSKSCSQHEKRNEIEPCGYCSIKVCMCSFLLCEICGGCFCSDCAFLTYSTHNESAKCIRCA